MKTNSLAESGSNGNLISVESLVTDASIALFLLDLADNAGIPESRSLYIREAHHAYQTILSILEQLNATTEQRQILSREMETLKARLTAAGLVIE